MITRSPLAVMTDHPQDVDDRANPIPWGLCVHTTGGGVPTRAKQLGIEPLQVAHDIYSAPGGNFPHYVIDGRGTIMQIADERERARHCGISPEDRKLYLSGEWKKKVNPKVLAAWQERWPGAKSPLSLFPGTSTNAAYLGVELIPQLQDGPTGKFTQEQYNKLAALVHDIEGRYKIQLWGPTRKLVGHEDLEPLARWTSKGGWDPGALGQAVSAFSWARLRAAYTDQFFGPGVA